MTLTFSNMAIEEAVLITTTITFAWLIPRHYINRDEMTSLCHSLNRFWVNVKL